jgi:hypothetical protein
MVYSLGDFARGISANSGSVAVGFVLSGTCAFATDTNKKKKNINTTT